MKKVLIACDDQVLGTFYASELWEEGYDVVVYDVIVRDSGVHEALRDEDPDLVLVACAADRYRGSDLHRSVRNGTCRIPVLLCVNRPPSCLGLTSEDAHGILLKQSDLSELKAAVRASLGQRRPHWKSRKGMETLDTQAVSSISGREVPERGQASVRYLDYKEDT